MENQLPIVTRVRWTPLAYVRIRIIMVFANFFRVRYNEKALQAIREGEFKYAFRQLKRGLEACLDAHLAIKRDVYTLRDLYEAGWHPGLRQGTTAKVFEALARVYGLEGTMFERAWQLRTLSLENPSDVSKHYEEFLEFDNALIGRYWDGLPDVSRRTSRRLGQFWDEWEALEKEFMRKQRSQAVIAPDLQPVEVRASDLYQNVWKPAKDAVLKSTSDQSFLVRKNNVFILNNTGAEIWTSIQEPFSPAHFVQDHPTEHEATALAAFLLELARWRLLRRLNSQVLKVEPKQKLVNA